VFRVVDPKKDQTRESMAAMVLVGQLGFTIAAPIVAGALAGNYLDEKAGTKGLILIPMVLLGVVAGIFGAYRLIRKEIQ